MKFYSSLIVCKRVQSLQENIVTEHKCNNEHYAVHLWLVACWEILHWTQHEGANEILLSTDITLVCSYADFESEVVTFDHNYWIKFTSTCFHICSEFHESHGRICLSIDSRLISCLVWLEWNATVPINKSLNDINCESHFSGCLFQSSVDV